MADSGFFPCGPRDLREVVRDDGVVFPSAYQAALTTYGMCGFTNRINRSIRTGGKAGGHNWRYADEEKGEK